MKNAGANNMVPNSNAPHVDALKPPGKNQNEHGLEVGYVGEGSAPLEHGFLTEGPSDISGGH